MKKTILYIFVDEAGDLLDRKNMRDKNKATQSTYRLSEAFLEVLSVAGNLWAHCIKKILISQYTKKECVK